MNYFYTSIIFIFLVNFVQCWDTEQLEVFDVVEEVKVNFYEFLNVSRDAITSQIRTAFRKLSLELHPDKNPSENADEQFRNLVSIYEVLKDATKRKYYDEVLVNGLPNWRSAVYYYRHVRRVGLIELCLFLFVLISVGQYLVAWASYFERKFTLEQVRGRKQKKLVATIELPKPSLYNTLPVQLPALMWTIIKSIPFLVCLLKENVTEKFKQEPVVTESEEDSEPEIRSVRKRKPGFVVPNGPTFEPTYLTSESKTYENFSSADVPQVAPVAGGLWTDEDLSELAQLINRYPGGTPNRWNIIAEATGRSVAEITYMSNKLKASGYRPNVQESEPEEVRVKVKTKGAKLDDSKQSVWTQEQQKAMEAALAKYPKGAVDRWDCITECVPGKTKDECILRFKYLVELVKKQKEQGQE